MVQVYKRDRSPYWYAVLSDPRQPDGRVRLSTKCRSRGEARQMAEALQEKIDAELKRERASSGLIWSDAFELMMEAKPGAESTWGPKASQAAVVGRSCLGDFDLGTLTHAMLKQYVAERRATKVVAANKKPVKPKRGQKPPPAPPDRYVSDATIRRELSLISTVYRFVIEREAEGAPEENPLETFSRRHLKERKPEDRHYRPNQVEKIIGCLKSIEMRRIVVTLCYTGMRSGELRKLGWDEVDFDLAVIEFGNGDPTRAKGKRARRIPLNQLMVDTLLAQRAMLQDEGLYQAGGLVFPSRRVPGERYSFSHITRYIRKNTGDNAYTNHRLRHTFASWCLQGDLDPITVRDLLGHTTLAMTTRYAKLVSNSAADRFRKFDLPGLTHSVAHTTFMGEEEKA